MKISLNFQKKACGRLCFWKPLLFARFKKNHVEIVILKIKSKHSNLRSNFQTHNKVGDNFWTRILVDLYMFYTLTKYEENWRTHLTFRPTPSHQTRASRSPGLRPLKAWSAGPRRDIVGAWSKIKTPHQNSKELKFYASPPPPHTHTKWTFTAEFTKKQKKGDLTSNSKSFLKSFVKNDTFGT